MANDKHYPWTHPALEPAFRAKADLELSVPSEDGTRLHVQVDLPDGWQDKPTVVLSHGYCLTLQTWSLQRAALRAAGYRVVLWDQRGHGRSDRLTREHVSIDALGADLGAVIESAAPTGSLVLVGHSMGGMATLALSRRNPELIRERVGGVALVATSAGGSGLVSIGFGKLFDKTVVKAGPGLLERVNRVGEITARVRRWGRFIEEGGVAIWGFGDRPDHRYVRLTSDMIRETDLATVAYILPHLDDLDERDGLPALRGREVLVLNGFKDRMTPPSHSDAIVRELPSAEHAVIPKVGHMIMLESPREVSAQLLDLAGRVARFHPQPLPVS